jgi:hypothetical protein
MAKGQTTNANVAAGKAEVVRKSASRKGMRVRVPPSAPPNMSTHRQVPWKAAAPSANLLLFLLQTLFPAGGLPPGGRYRRDRPMGVPVNLASGVPPAGVLPLRAG